MERTDYTSLSSENLISLIKDDWMLVTAGNKESFNTMTANWGGMGFLWNKPVAFIFIRPERYTHDFLEENDHLTLSFYAEDYREALRICGTKSGRDINKVEATGLTPVALESGAMTFCEARLILDCHKLFKAPMQATDFIDKEILNTWYGAKGGLHDMYVVEIDDVYIK